MLFFSFHSDADLPFLVCHLSLITEDGQNADMLTKVDPKEAAEAQAASSSSVTTSTLSRQQQQQQEEVKEEEEKQQDRVEQQHEELEKATSASAISSSSNADQDPPTSVRLLYGTLVASPMQLYTPDNRLGNIFVFPEVSIRSRGRFRLQITVTRIPL